VRGRYVRARVVCANEREGRISSQNECREHAPSMSSPSSAVPSDSSSGSRGSQQWRQVSSSGRFPAGKRGATNRELHLQTAE